MADTENKKTEVPTSPEKKAIIEEDKKVVKESNDVAKKSRNGCTKEEIKGNGATSEEKDGEDEKEAESTENGESTEIETPTDACCIKRKSTSLKEVKEDGSTEGASPEKKSKIEEKPAEAESNGDATATAEAAA